MIRAWVTSEMLPLPTANLCIPGSFLPEGNFLQDPGNERCMRRIPHVAGVFGSGQRAVGRNYRRSDQQNVRSHEMLGWGHSEKTWSKILLRDVH